MLCRLTLMLGLTLLGESSMARETIVFMGDSLTAGYGLSREEAYPALIGANIAEASLDFEVVNAGLSGDTTAGGCRRIAWLLRRQIDVLIIALGANDGLRGIDTATTEENLQSIIDAMRNANPCADIIVAGMKAPPNMGQDFATVFESLFATLAQANDVLLIPFLLEGVAGVRELNQPDGIHPTPRGQETMAAMVWQCLEPVLKRRQQMSSSPGVSEYGSGR